MFDFKPTAAKGRKAYGKAVRGDANMRSAQDRMPLADVEGIFLRLKDGATCVYMTYPGANLSLMTVDQAQDYALRNGQVLSAITANSAGIWLLPERVSAESNLDLADRRIRELTEKAYLSGGGTAEDERCLELLENHIRPMFAREAIASENVAWRTYLGLRFETRSDDEIKLEVNSLADMISDRVGKRPRVLADGEILDFIELYVKGWHVEERFLGTKVVMPGIR